MTGTRSRLLTRLLAPPLLGLALLTLVGLLLRLFHLGEQSFWFDEAQTLSIASLPVSRVFLQAYRPPLYQLGLHFWRLIVPDTEAWLRLPSALLGAAIPPLIYLLAVRLYDRRTALLASLLAVFSPTLLRYAQELRMYSLMAVEFLVLLMLFLRIADRSHRLPGWLWVSLGFVEVASLYTHYFAIPFLFWLNVFAVLMFLLGRRWVTLRAWIAVQLAAAVAFIPWLWIILRGRGGAEDYLAAETIPVLSAAPRVRDFVAQSWAFYAGLPPRQVPAWMTCLAVAGAVVLGIAMLVLAARVILSLRRGRPPEGPLSAGGVSAPWSDALLLVLVLGPFLTAVLMYKFRPGVVHPRHLMMLIGPLLMLIARISTLGMQAFFWSIVGQRGPRFRQIRTAADAFLGVATLLGFVALFGAGLRAYYENPGDSRPDMRALARYVTSLTTADDVVLIPYIDYAFDYYYKGPAMTYRLETRVGDEDLAGWFLPRAQGARRAVLLRWVQIFADGREFLPWFLRVNGRLLGQQWVADRLVSVYDLNSPLMMPPLSPTDVRFGPFLLKGAYVPASSAADQPLSVALQWTLNGAVSTDYKVSLRVLDRQGAPVAQDDRVLLNEQGSAPTSRWLSGVTTHNYYAATLPPGTPPLSYTLVVSVYSEKGPLDRLSADGHPLGKAYTLGACQVTPPTSFPPTFSSSVPMTAVGREVAPGLRLEGFALNQPLFRSGETLVATLYWRATVGGLPAYQPQIRIVSPTGADLGSQRSAPVYGLYPTTRWQAGELVSDRREVIVSPEAESGTANVELGVEGGASIVLQPVQIEKTDRQFALPKAQYPLEITFGNAARLRGFDLEKQTVTRGEPLRVMLYWEALNEAPIPTSYAVFAHLLDPQSQMVAQHDGLPAEGKWLTTSWVKGQIITDVHPLAFKEGNNYTGEAILEIGLYDSKSFARLTTSGGEDRFVLPVQITVR